MRWDGVPQAGVLILFILFCFLGESGTAEEMTPQQKRLNSQQKLRARLGVYVVVWEVTPDQKGKVETIRIAKIIPPEGEEGKGMAIEIPAVYQENARKKLAQRKYQVMTEVVETLEPRPVKGRKKRSHQKVVTKVTKRIPTKVFTSSYYDPQRPDEVIVKLPRR
jgi:hypothetical protein